MATHSSTLAWKIPWIEEPGRLQSWGRKELDLTEWLHFHFSLLCIGGGNGNPLQCSCLENPRDGGTWWAAIYGIEQSWTRLQWLSSNSSSFYKVIFFYFSDKKIRINRNEISNILSLQPIESSLVPYLWWQWCSRLNCFIYQNIFIDDFLSLHFFPFMIPQVLGLRRNITLSKLCSDLPI